MKLFAKLLFPIVLLCSSAIFLGMDNESQNPSILNTEELLSTGESTNESTTDQEDTSWGGFFSNLVGEENYNAAEGYLSKTSSEQRFMFSLAAIGCIYFVGMMFPKVSSAMDSGLKIISFASLIKGFMDFADQSQKDEVSQEEEVINGLLE